jgi:hypothetical protein
MRSTPAEPRNGTGAASRMVLEGVPSRLPRARRISGLPGRPSGWARLETDRFCAILRMKVNTAQRVS